MPGPGGGGHGGGFGGGSHGGGFGGGSHGGGFGGHHGGGFGGPRGGFGGGPRGGFHGGFPPFFHRRPFFFAPWGGGCLGVLVFPLILLVIVFAFFGGVINSCFYGNENSHTSVVSYEYKEYDEETFQDYANDQYFSIFGNSQDTEDQILLVFTTNDSFDGYYSIAWVGYHINEDIINMFGNEDTAYGKSVQSHVQNMYKYSFESSMCSVIKDMMDKITEMSTSSYENCPLSKHTPPKKGVYNYSSLQLSGTLEDAIQSFTKETGIPLAIVIVPESEVFS